MSGTSVLPAVCMCLFLYIQGDSGDRVNILGGGKIGHCEKKVSYEQVSNSELLSC